MSAPRGLARSARIRRRKEFVHIQQTGRRVQLSDMVAMIGKRASTAQDKAEAGAKVVGPRIGFTVSSKSGNAVTRNRIKRVLREAWRLERERFAGSIDLVLIARRSAISLTRDKAREQLIELANVLMGNKRPSPQR